MSPDLRGLSDPKPVTGIAEEVAQKLVGGLRNSLWSWIAMEIPQDIAERHTQRIASALEAHSQAFAQGAEAMREAAAKAVENAAAKIAEGRRRFPRPREDALTKQLVAQHTALFDAATAIRALPSPPAGKGG